jgi:hypothetical protein
MRGIDPDAPLGRAAAWLVALLLLVPCTVYALASMYTDFADYDDQGFFMLTVRHVLQGARLYQDVPVLYGPFYYLERWLLHGALGVPLTHDAVRLVATLHWLAAALSTALLAAAVVRGGGFPLATFALTLVISVVQLGAVAHEPGHPQEIGALLVPLSLLGVAVCPPRRGHLRAGILGATGAALLLTKINLGGLYLGAAATAWLADGLRRRAPLAWMAAVAAFAIPFLMMRGHLGQPWAQKLLAVWAVGYVPTLVLALRGRAPVSGGIRELVTALAAGLAVFAVCMLFVVLAGTSPLAALRGFVIDPLQYAGMAVLQLRMTWTALPSVAASGAAAVAFFAAGPRVRTWLVLLAKACFAGVALAATDRLVEMLVWVWLVAVPPERGEATDDPLPRRLCALVGGALALQAYPLAGSQVSFAQAVLLPAAFICLSDALEAMLGRLAGAAARRAHQALAVVAVALALVLVVPRALDKASIYRRLPPVDLPGMHWQHMAPRGIAVYHCMVDNLRALSDTFLSVGGHNSFYFWTGIEPASPITLTHFWGLLDAERQRRLLDDYTSHQRFVFVDAPPLFASRSTGREPLIAHVAQHFRPAIRIGPFTLKVHKDRTDVKTVGCPRRRDGGA